MLKLSNWPEWQAADDKQLDSHFDSGTIEKAVPRPKKDISKPSQVFRLLEPDPQPIPPRGLTW